MKRFWQEHQAGAVIVLILRLYLGYAWLMAGLEKVSGFDATGFLKHALTLTGGDHPAVQGWWAAFLEHVALPAVPLINVLIPIGEILVGLGLMLGGLTLTAAFFGMVMNFSFLLSGTTSTNPQMIILALLIMLAADNAGRIGLDRWIRPYLKKFFQQKKHASGISA